jgi:3-oxoadipate enol-lactonase
MPYAQHKRVKLYFEEHGEGEPLVLLMGLGVPIEGWVRQIPHFSKRYRTIVIDNRGIGRSSKPLTPYSASLMARDAVHVLDHLSLPKAHLVGVSMGGMIAMEMAARYPERVSSAVLSSTCAYADSTVRIRIGSVVARVALSYLRARGGKRGEEAAYQTLRKEWLPLTFSNLLGPEDVTEVDQMMEACRVAGWSPAGFGGQLAAVFTHDVRKRARRISAPLMVVGGDQDQAFEVHRFHELATMLGARSFHLMAGAPHGLNFAHAKDFNTAVTDFLKGLSPRPVRARANGHAAKPGKPRKRAAPRKTAARTARQAPSSARHS